VRVEPVDSAPSAPRARHWAIALQVLASLLILAMLLREAQPHAVLEALASVSWTWLGLALLAKVLALTLHELRLWWLLRGSCACSLRGVVGIGFLGGLVNMVLPIRAGDLVAMLLLSREQRIPGPVAVSAVGLVALLEAAALGLFLLVIFGTGLVFWEQALGAEGVQTALSTVSIVTLVGVVAVVSLGVVGRMLGGRGARQEWSPGLVYRLRDAVALGLQHTGGTLGRVGALLTNLALALVDVGLFLTSYAILVFALDLPVPGPWTAAGAVMALSAVASLVLPPSLGAGTAAASVFALGLFGVDEPTALAYAALVWLVGSLPSLLLGLPPLLSRMGSLAEIILGVRSAPEPSRPRG